MLEEGGREGVKNVSGSKQENVTQPLSPSQGSLEMLERLLDFPLDVGEGPKPFCL